MLRGAAGGERWCGRRKELKAFAKVHLDPGEETTVTFTLDQRALAIWDPVARRVARRRRPL